MWSIVSSTDWPYANDERKQQAVMQRIRIIGGSFMISIVIAEGKDTFVDTVWQLDAVGLLVSLRPLRSLAAINLH
jgi:hypothetical protein